MFYSYTGGEHKSMLVRLSLNINAPSSCCYLSKFYCRKETWAMQKLFIRKKKRKKIKKVEKKMDKCLRYVKQWVLRCPPEKKDEMNKIAPAL